MVALRLKISETNLGLASPEMNKTMDFVYALEHLIWKQKLSKIIIITKPKRNNILATKIDKPVIHKIGVTLKIKQFQDSFLKQPM